jgi:lipoprotein signal peptidase
VDFVHVHHWPVFNVADVYLTIGYVLLALGFFAYRRGPMTMPRESG